MTLKIEAGKYYRTRDGQKVGPISRGNSCEPYLFWKAPTPLLNRASPTWCECGSYYPVGHGFRNNYIAALDLIAEWTDPIPYGHVQLSDGRTVDLTTNTTPFGLMNEVHGDGAADAMEAHGGPYEVYCYEGYWGNIFNPSFAANIVYRVKSKPPAPKVKAVAIEHRQVVGDVLKGYRITFNVIDGEPDCASVRMVKL